MARDYFTANSKFIQSAGYDDQTLILGIRFKSGEVWNYGDVPVEVWNSFKAAASKGSYFHSQIKGLYSAQQVQ